MLDTKLTPPTSMPSHIILADDCTKMTTVSPDTKSKISLVPFIRSFSAMKYKRWVGELGPGSYYNSTVYFWEFRHRGPPSHDIIAHAGDTYLDISTTPVGVYQNTSAGWISCWSEPRGVNLLSKKEFNKLLHPRLKHRFLWTTKSDISEEILLSYITHEELDARGGTEKDKQDFLFQDLQNFYPTAETYVARREAAHQAGENSLESSSRSSSMDAVNGDHDDEDTDKSTEVESVSGNDSVDRDNANEDSASCKIAEIAGLVQTILKEVKNISSVTSSFVKHPKYPAGGSMSLGDHSSTVSSSSKWPLDVFPQLSTGIPQSEADNIYMLLSQVENETKKHLKEIYNLRSAVQDTKAKLKVAQEAKKVAYDNISAKNKMMVKAAEMLRGYSSTIDGDPNDDENI